MCVKDSMAHCYTHSGLYFYITPSPFPKIQGEYKVFP